jgi:hypothetical protein
MLAGDEEEYKQRVSARPLTSLVAVVDARAASALGARPQPASETSPPSARRHDGRERCGSAAGGSFPHPMKRAGDESEAGRVDKPIAVVRYSRRGESTGAKPMKAKLLLISVVVVALVFALGAAQGLAVPAEVKWKLALVPCGPVGEDDAGGEAEYESDSRARSAPRKSADRGEQALLKVEVWGATLYRGETLAVEVDGRRVGTLPVDEIGRGSADIPGVIEPDIDVSVGLEPLEELPDKPIITSDRGLC